MKIIPVTYDISETPLLVAELEKQLHEPVEFFKGLDSLDTPERIKKKLQPLLQDAPSFGILGAATLSLVKLHFMLLTTALLTELSGTSPTIIVLDAKWDEENQQFTLPPDPYDWFLIS